MDQHQDKIPRGSDNERVKGFLSSTQEKSAVDQQVDVTFIIYKSNVFLIMFPEAFDFDNFHVVEYERRVH